MAHHDTRRVRWERTEDGGRQACVRHVRLDTVDGRVKATCGRLKTVAVDREWDTATDWHTGRWVVSETAHETKERVVVSVHDSRRAAMSAAEALCFRD